MSAWFNDNRVLEVAYQVADQDLAVSMCLGGRSSGNIGLCGSFGGLGVLLDTTNGSGGGRAFSTSRATGTGAGTGGALVGLEDLVKGLVELVGHFG